MTLDEAKTNAERLGRAIQKADDELRFNDRAELSAEWVEFLDRYRGREDFYTLFHAHWNVRKKYHPRESKCVFPEDI